MVCPCCELAASCVLNTQRSDDPLSKSMTKVWPPIFTGERYSVSPDVGLFVTTPTPLVLLLPVLLLPFPVEEVPVDDVPVDVGAAAGCDGVG